MGGFAEKNGRAGSLLPAASPAETAWPMVRLGDVCEVRAGATHHGIMSKTGKYPAYGSGGYICQVSEYRCPANTVTVGRKGTLDKPLLIEEPFWNIDTCFGVIPSGKVNPRYLWRFCQSFDFYALVPTIGRPSTNSDAIKEILLPLPPLSVQREIVERLEKELGEAEKITAGFRRIAEKAEAEFKAELDETFKALEDDVSRGGAETRRVRLGDVCETGSGGTPLSSNREYYDGGDVPWLRSGEICKRDIGNTEYCITKKGLNSSSAKIFPADSVVVAMYGATAGQVGILRIASSTNQAICAILPSEKFVPEFLYYQLCWLNDEMVSQAQGGAQPNISQIKIKNLNVVWPILSLQQASISRLDAARERCDKIKAEAEKGLKAAENLRKAILKEAFER